MFNCSTVTTVSNMGEDRNFGMENSMEDTKGGKEEFLEIVEDSCDEYSDDSDDYDIEKRCARETRSPIFSLLWKTFGSL